MPVEQHEESTFVRHEPCEKCGSSDANSLFSDGHLFCFSCNTYTPAEGDAVITAPAMNTNLIHGEPKAIPARGLNEDDCRKFGYQIGTKPNGEPVQIAQYRDKQGNVIAQKVRGRQNLSNDW